MVTPLAAALVVVVLMVLVPLVVKVEAFEYFASEVPYKLIAVTGCPGYLVPGPDIDLR